MVAHLRLSLSHVPLHMGRGALGIRGLRVWPISASGFRVFPKNCAGFRVKYIQRATGFAIFLARVSDIVVKMCGFSGFQPDKGCQCVNF